MACQFVHDHGELGGVTRSAQAPTGRLNLPPHRPTEVLEAKDRPREPLGTDIVIILTRLGNGMQIAVNPDLIERAEHTPDTVLTLVDGHKLVVEEPLDEVVTLIRTWRASVAAEAIALSRLADGVGPHTTMLTSSRYDTGREIDSERDHQDAVLRDKAAQASQLGRILQLPAREV
jgi:flagellar protein FlbD